MRTLKEQTVFEPVSASIYYGFAAEQQADVGRVIGGLATKYDVEPADFSLFRTVSEKRGVVLAVVHADKAGIDLAPGIAGDDKRRAYRGIFSDKELSGHIVKVKNISDTFRLECDTGTYDTRRGMSRWVYGAMVARARRALRPLPDAYDFSEGSENISQWTWTALTGEGSIRDCMPIACSMNNDMYSTGTDLSNGAPNLRFRPGVILGERGDDD